MPSSTGGGALGTWGEKSPEKKVSECVWGYFGWVLTMFLDGFDAFWALQTPIWVLGQLLNPSTLRGGVWGLSRLGWGLG